MRLLPEEFFDHFANLGHAGHTADEDDLVNAALVDACVSKSLLAGLQRAFDQIANHLLEIRTADGFDQVQRSG